MGLVQIGDSIQDGYVTSKKGNGISMVSRALSSFLHSSIVDFYNELVDFFLPIQGLQATPCSSRLKQWPVTVKRRLRLFLGTVQVEVKMCMMNIV